MYIITISLLCVGGTIGMFLFNPDMFSTHYEYTKNAFDGVSNNIAFDHASIDFKHNFCESLLQKGEGPEILNSITSLAISITPFIVGFPNYPPFYNVACMLSVNGIASCYYHYSLTWLGKQADEISMILANHFALMGLTGMYYEQSPYGNRLNSYNLIFMYLFLVLNTLHQYDVLFPSLFGVYVGGTLVMIHKVSVKYRVPYTIRLFVSLLGALCWIVSEHACSSITKYGHPLWHVLFPFGFYKLLLDYDVARTELPHNE
jgi:hypothetical protein